MTRSRCALVLAIVLLGVVPVNSKAQQAGVLYSPQKYRNERVSFCLNFQTGLSYLLSGPCDLHYGLLGINNDFNWLQISSAQKCRTVFKDLGSHKWTDDFEVPVVVALRKLEPGEQRTISVDASGADGARGADGSGSFEGFVRPRVESSRKQQSIRDGKPHLDPIFLKVVIGHIYVVHVVDNVSDYYALFRVDDLQDMSCSISWKLIPAPQQ
jgi:hypothetical protein